MFETAQEFILKSESLDSPDETQRFAYCQIHLYPLTYAIAKEVSPDLASCLFVLTNPGKHARSEYTPRRGVRSMVLDQTFKPHELIFQPHPELPITGKISPVEIKDVQAVKARHSIDYTLVLGLRFKISDRGIASAFLFDRFKQPVFIQLNELQLNLPLDAVDVASHHNKQASNRQLAIGAPAK